MRQPGRRPSDPRSLPLRLRAQLDGLGPASERQRARILTIGDPDAFLAWTERVRPLLEPDTEAVPDTLRELYRRVLDDTRLGPRSLLRRMAADQGTDAASMIRRHSADAVRRAMSSGSWAALIRDVVQDWWREQAPRTAVTVRDDMRQEDFLPLPLHLGALHETLRWCGEAAEAAGARIDVELTVQNGALHVWLGLDRVHVRSACEDFARLLSHTLPYTDCLVADDHVLLRLHGRPDTEVLSPLAAAGLDAYLSSTDVERRQYLERAAEEPMGEKQQVS